MGLKLICGRAGSGKTSYCFNEIKQIVDNEKKIYIITPEQFSYTAEKNLIDTLKENSVIKAEVLTFDRMAYRVFQEVGGLTKNYLSDAITSMIIYNILDKQKNNLTFLGKSTQNVNIVSRMFTELNKHKIKTEEIKHAITNTQELYLKRKLEDILILKESFEKSIPQDYSEGASKLTYLAEKLQYSNIFDDSILYLDEFSGYTKQEYTIIEELLKKTKQINITICTDSLEELKNIETDIFYSNNQTALKLIDIAKKNNVEVLETFFLEDMHRFKNKELSHMEENIYRIEQKEYTKENENIELFLAKNPYSEIENLVKEIIYLVREKGYRYREIAVITNNVDNYRAITKAIFEQYEIPVFMDQKRDLTKNILVQFLLSVFEIFSKNFSYDSIFAYLKTGLTELENDEIYKLENYCIKWGIKGKKWYKEDWNYGNIEKNELEELNYLRNIIVEPLIKLKEEMSKQKTVRMMCERIYLFLEENNIFNILNEKIQELERLNKLEIANEYETSIKIIIDLLDEMVCTFGDEKVSFEKYRELLKIGLENKTLGVIPGTRG